MIAVVGCPAYAGDGRGVGGFAAAGAAVEVAAAAVRTGSQAELVGKVGDDPAGDEVVVALGRLGVGHAALLRDAGRPTPAVATTDVMGDALDLDSPAAVAAAEPASAGPASEAGEAGPTLLPADPAARPVLEAADVELALRYLSEIRVVVGCPELTDGALAAAAAGAAFGGAALIVLVAPGAAVPGLPAEAIVLEAPAADDGAFGRLVGTFAARLDRGGDAARSFGEAVAEAGWETVAG